MSIVGTYDPNRDTHVPLSLDYTKDKQGNQIIQNILSPYKPDDASKNMIVQVIERFRYSDIIMRKPRREFNDLSVLTRTMVDQMAFNCYQPNDGDALQGDITESWKSRAIKPVERNKVISIAAHSTAQLIFPKVFAFDKTNHEQEDAANIMTDLMEWAADKSDYLMTNLFAIIASLVNPAAIVYTDYSDVYRKVKREKENGVWKSEYVCDESLSGFNDTVVPVDEFYISNFYENDVQKQDWLIWRRVQSYSMMQAKYGDLDKYPNFKYVKPGVQLLYNDANVNFYEVYDSNLRQELCEEIIYWEKTRDLKLILVNGVLLTDPEEPNPRDDKLYPFVSFGYEPMDEGKCFYYKSLVFKMKQDAKIVNTLYPMIIDGTYLSIMPPMVNSGTEEITSDVIVPGAVATISQDSTITPLQLGQNLVAGFNALNKVEESIAQTANEQPPPTQRGKMTAYELSVRQKELITLLGPFVQMIMKYVKHFGKLRLGDILQYMTIGELKDLEGDELVYKTFFLPESSTRTKTKKIEFDGTLPDEPTEEENENISADIYEQEGGKEQKISLAKVNPRLFRKLAFVLSITPEVLTPMTEDVKNALKLEIYDRAIANQSVDQEAVTKEFLFGAFPLSRKDPEKFMKKTEALGQANPLQQMMMQQPGSNILPAMQQQINPGINKITQ